MASPTFRQISENAVLEMEAGNWAAARAHWLSALALVPDSVEVMLELSYAESSADHYRAARDWVLRAAKTPPRSIDDVLTLMQRLRTFNEVPILRGIATALLASQRTPPPLLVECARHLSNLNDFDMALRCAQAAAGNAPADWSARLVRGQLLANYGRIVEAATDFEWVSQRYPHSAMAWWLLSRLRKQTAQSNHVPQLRKLLQTPDLASDDVAVAARALHKELDDLGDYDGAWQALEIMCKARRSTVEYDAADSHGLIDRLIELPLDGLGKTSPRSTNRIPVFIVGMHRSGTTLMEQLLDANADVRGLGELSDFASAMRHATDHYCKAVVDATLVERASELDLVVVGQRYLAGVEWRLGDEHFFTDKLPSNFLNVGFICRALPEAKILHMVRDPVETCFSNLRELFSEVNPYSYDQLELADYFRQYRRLMAHWHAAYPGRILDVHYGDLTRNPESTMREVTAFCGIDYVEAMSDPRSSKRAVATASAVQVREKVVLREQPKWKPYEQHLQPLIQALRAQGFVQ